MTGFSGDSSRKQNVQEQLIPVQGKTPKVEDDVFIAPNSTLIGEVEVGKSSSIWFNCTIRGDVFPIKIGNRCNVQDGTIMHGMYQKYGVVLEDDVSIGHGVILHGCLVGEGSLVGMGSVVMDNAKIGKGCLVAAGSLVTEGTEVPDGHLAIGRPAKVLRELNKKEKDLLKYTTGNYLMYKDWFKEEEP